MISLFPLHPSLFFPTRRLAMMNLAIRGIEGDLGPVYASKLEAAIKTNLKGRGYGS